MVGVRAVILDDLGVVDIGLAPTADDFRIGRIGEIVNEQSLNGTGPTDIDPRIFRMDRHIVRFREPGKQGVGAEGEGRSHYCVVPEAGQIEHLQTGLLGLTDHHHVVVHHFDVPPKAVGQSGGRQLPHRSRHGWIGHVDEPRPVPFAEQHVFPTIERISPTPQVIGIQPSCIGIRHLGEQLHPITRPDPFNESTDALALPLNWECSRPPQEHQEKASTELRQAGHGREKRKRYEFRR